MIKRIKLHIIKIRLLSCLYSIALIPRNQSILHDVFYINDENCNIFEVDIDKCKYEFDISNDFKVNILINGILVFTTENVKIKIPKELIILLYKQSKIINELDNNLFIYYKTGHAPDKIYKESDYKKINDILKKKEE